MFLHPTGVDITERKRIEAELQDSEQRLRYVASIVESSDDAIVSKNLDGIITSWNRGAERIFGYTAEEAVGQPIMIVIWTTGRTKSTRFWHVSDAANASMISKRCGSAGTAA